ncbi:capsule biosynthesis protein, putative [Babesia ovata]|uniref:Capsule biosynthesis protein, putative n=1 Tax=Babesia ovata TaxID=189622 RepID=A0A2H6KCK3_9APIC|nr:capsule biosynthesis protein, putative [Babesia ovata]GBE60689.1 capsule biosynthesis protein, putative [Babesia ovata]
MAAALKAGLPRLGLDPDEDIVNYLIALIEAEGPAACAEWLESAATGDHGDAALELAEAASAELRGQPDDGGISRETGSSSANSGTTGDSGDPLDSLDIAIDAAKAAGNAARTTNSGSGWGQKHNLDKGVRREIVQRYACVDIQTIHIGDDGQVCSSGTTTRSVEKETDIPTNDNAARVKQEQHARRMSQKQQHLEAQEKQRQQKLKQQQHDEKERMRCQKKERQR